LAWLAIIVSAILIYLRIQSASKQVGAAASASQASLSKFFSDWDNGAKFSLSADGSAVIAQPAFSTPADFPSPDYSTLSFGGN